MSPRSQEPAPGPDYGAGRGAGKRAAAAPVRTPNVHPECRQVPRIGDDGIKEVCHLVTEEDPDTALCGADVTGYPWNPPWPRCEACVAVAEGKMN